MEREEDMSTTPANAPDMSQLYAALVLAQSKCGFIKMTGRNREQGYDFASDEDIMKVIRPALSEAGLVAIPMNHMVTRSERQTARGGTMQIVDVVTEYLIAHTSGQSIVVQAIGCGQDTGDKAIYKAITGSLKYLYRSMFALPIGLSPETSMMEDKPAGKPKETKEEKAARQAEHDSSWEAAKPGFMVAISKLGIGYDDLKAYLAAQQPPLKPPSQMHPTFRDKMLVRLSESEGLEAFREWIGKQADGGGR